MWIGLRQSPIGVTLPPQPPPHLLTTHTPRTYHTHTQVYAPPPSAGHPTGTGEEGQLLDNLRRRESRRSISTTQDDMGIPPAPSAQPTDDAKQMLDPTLNLG